MRAVLAAVLLWASIGWSAPPATIVFLSDFGTTDDAVAICKGVILGLAPEARVIDLTHQVTPFAIADGARLLAATAPYYPAGTVFLAVVDPGVGSARKAMIARTRRDQYFVLPDNGLVTLVADRDGLAGAREIRNAAWMRDAARSSTFHGRDVFAPAAARLTRGDDWTDAGPPIEAPVRLPDRAAAVDGDVVRGEVIALDGPYGNLVTNVGAPLLTGLGWVPGDRVPVEVAGERLALPFVRTFGDVAAGEALLYIDSHDKVALAINRGSFAEVHHLTPPVALVIRRKR